MTFSLYKGDKVAKIAKILKWTKERLVAPFPRFPFRRVQDDDSFFSIENPASTSYLTKQLPRPMSLPRRGEDFPGMVQQKGAIVELPGHLSQGEDMTEHAARTSASPSLRHPDLTIPQNTATRTLSRQTSTSGGSSWSSEDGNSAPPSPPAIVLGMADGVLDNGDAAPRAIEETMDELLSVCCPPAILTR